MAIRSIKEMRRQATVYRKTGQCDKALPLYQELWKITQNKFDGSGLLHCLRKLQLFEQAIPFAKDLIKHFPDFEWARREWIWTKIQGELQLQDDLETALADAKALFEHNLDPVASWYVIDNIIKRAKQVNKWQEVDKWLGKIAPERLRYDSKMLWCDRCRWHNYRIRSYYELQRYDEVLTAVKEGVAACPHNVKFFRRWQARAYQKMGEREKAKAIFQNLCGDSHLNDWWLLHDYGKLLWQDGNLEGALAAFSQAAAIRAPLAGKVNLFTDIGELCAKMGKLELARAHYILVQLLREEQQWEISSFILTAIEELNIALDTAAPTTIKEALHLCQQAWRKGSVQQTARQDLQGMIKFVPQRDFCFVHSNEDSYFCHKSILPSQVRDGDVVVFDAILAYDKKKQQQAWRVKEIKQVL